MPSQHRTDSLPDLDIVPLNSRSASSSPITTTENPWQPSTASRSQSLRPASPPQIGPAARPYSPQYRSSFSPPDIYQYNNLLPPTIPNLEQPTPLTNPLPFQHEYRNQVPIEGEYPSAVQVQDDAILPAPPPYSRYAAGEPQKSEPERRRPQLDMIDVSAAVRGLPTVHIAVGPDGNVNSSSNSHLQNGSDIAPAEPFIIQQSDSEISMQSAQSSALSTNSNRLLMRLLMRGRLSENVKQEKVKNNKRACGIKLWRILLAIAFVSILLSIVLGITLGMAKKRNRRSGDPKPDGGRNLPDNSQNSIFPESNILVPLTVVKQNQTCLTNNSEPSELTGEALWACDIAGSQLYFEIKTNDYSGPPATLPHRMGTADEAEFVITSTDGASGKHPLRYGFQSPNFFHQPLYRVLQDNGGKGLKEGPTGGSPKYDFRVLYTKEIILRDSAIVPPSGVKRTEVGNGEIVWYCKWDKTYIEGRVWMETVNGISKKVDSAFRMTLRESRLSDQELQQLLPGSNTTDAAKGAITCQKKMNRGGNLVDIPAGPGGNISSGITRAKEVLEARAVEEVVRRRFGRANISKRHSPQFQQTERADGAGQCLCEWSG